MGMKTSFAIKRLRHRIISDLLRPSSMRAAKAFVCSCHRSFTTTTRSKTVRKDDVSAADYATNSYLAVLVMNSSAGEFIHTKS